jgi:membrane peptidoglycan carboxypeptidase
MEMNPYPFWKVLLLAPRLFQNHGKSPPDFFAASLAARSLIASQSPPRRSLDRAVTELFGAIWISEHWSAEETANTLLGNANFCHGFSGMEAAARGYYGFPVDELTNEEVAFLSGISRGACGYSPWWNRQRAGQRAARVLSALSQDKALEVGTDTNACFNRLKPPPKQARTTIR